MSEAIHEPWAPLFAEIAPAERVCWPHTVQVEAPLAVPPPWVGTATMILPAGCGELMDMRPDDKFWRYDLVLEDTAFAITLTVQRDGTVVSQRTHQSAHALFDRRGQVGLVKGGSVLWVTLGDALPWATPAQDLDGYFADMAYEAFFCEVGIPLDALIAATGSTPYAGIGVSFAVSADEGPVVNIPVPHDFGSTTPERRVLIKAVDPAQLTPWLRRMRARLARPARRPPRATTCPRWPDEPLPPTR